MDRHSKAERWFWITFVLALSLEVVRWLSMPESVVGHLSFWLGYALLFALGLLLGRDGLSYRAALAWVWPFVLLWFVVGYFTIRYADLPRIGLSGDEQDLALLGYLIATVLFLPVAYGATAFGVLLGHRFWSQHGGTSAA